jgi:hypothetical protein
VTAHACDDYSRLKTPYSRFTNSVRATSSSRFIQIRATPPRKRSNEQDFYTCALRSARKLRLPVPAHAYWELPAKTSGSCCALSQQVAATGSCSLRALSSRVLPCLHSDWLTLRILIAAGKLTANYLRGEERGTARLGEGVRSEFYTPPIYESIINRRREGTWQKLNNSVAWRGLPGADGVGVERATGDYVWVCSRRDTVPPTLKASMGIAMIAWASQWSSQ